MGYVLKEEVVEIATKAEQSQGHFEELAELNTTVIEMRVEDVWPEEIRAEFPEMSDKVYNLMSLRFHKERNAHLASIAVSQKKKR